MVLLSVGPYNSFLPLRKTIYLPVVHKISQKFPLKFEASKHFISLANGSQKHYKAPMFSIKYFSKTLPKIGQNAFEKMFRVQEALKSLSDSSKPFKYTLNIKRKICNIKWQFWEKKTNFEKNLKIIHNSPSLVLSALAALRDQVAPNSQIHFEMIPQFKSTDTMGSKKQL